MSLTQQDKKKLKPKIVKNISAAQFAYASGKKEVEKLDRMEVSEGTIVFSDMYEETESGKFRATVFIDRKNKQITYAIAGTRMGQETKKAIADLRDDLRLAVGLKPKKIKSMQRLNEMLINALMDEAGTDPKARAEALKGYEINFTGHSLGAVLSDCAAADMVLHAHKVGLNISNTSISSVTFDNPGAVTLVKSICKGYKGANIDAVKQYVDYKAFNNRDNFINTLDNQVGVKYIIVPHNQKPLNGFFGMCGHIARKCKSIPVVRAIFKHLSYGRIGQQMADHSLSNFDDVLSKGNGFVRSAHSRRLMSIDEVTTGKEPLKYDAGLFKLLKDQTREEVESHKKTLLYSMTDSLTLERIEFSYEELVQALGAKKLALGEVSKSSVVEKSFKKTFVQKLLVKKHGKKTNTKKTYTQRSAEEVVSLAQKKGSYVGRSFLSFGYKNSTSSFGSFQ